MLRRSPFLVLVALLAGCGTGEPEGDPLAPPQLGVVTRVTSNGRDVDLTLVHGCTGEPIVFTGRVHERFTSHFDAAGGLHLGIHVNPQGLVGLGADGTVYRANGTYNERLVSAAGSAEVLTVNSSLHIVGQGPDNDFRLHELLHVTVTPNGEVTSDVAKTTTSCT